MRAGRMVIPFLLATPLVACAPPEAEEPPAPFLARIVCDIQRWLERHEFRVREEDVGRCSGAARQIETTRERMQEALRQTIEPDGGKREGEGSAEPGRVSP